jgi:Omp85 superfamily domain
MSDSFSPWQWGYCALFLAAIGVADAAPTPTPPEALQSNLPSDAELENSGALIGTIDIDNQDIFDPRDPREDRALFRLTNRLHIETRPELIRQQLLFKTGDRYSKRLLDESERILRAERFIYDADIVPTRYADGRVDLMVTTRDVWSLNPGVSFGRRGGKSTYGIELEELNLLGRGVAIALSKKSGVDRDILRFDFIDRHLLGRRLELLASYANNSDGNAWELGLERPFFALDTRWAAGVDFAKFERIDPLYQLGEETYRFREQARTAEIYAGRSAGLSEGWVQRWLVGLTLDQHRFDPLPLTPPPFVLPEDRDLAYPWIGWELVEDQFDTKRNHDQIERTEDVFLGTRLQARLGYSSTGLGADRNALIYQATVDRGFKPSPSSTLTLSTALNGRNESGNSADLLLETEARYYYEQDEHWLFFASVDAAYGKNLDTDHQILLGGDNGLRGYPLRYQGGDKRARFTLEQRYFSDWYPFRLFRVGGAVFFDAGRTWGDDELGTPNLGVLKDVGIGLRLGNSRSGLGSIIHIDLAFPLDGPSDIDNVQLLLETRREF